jgi:hypothetical protein
MVFQIMLQSSSNMIKGISSSSSPFKFNASWLDDKYFKDLVKNEWSSFGPSSMGISFFLVCKIIEEIQRCGCWVGLRKTN